MFNYIKGELVEIKDNLVVLETNKIGYEIYVSGTTISSLENLVGEEIKLHTYFQVREDGISLFGFYNLDEKEMFLNLIAVSGIGPKGAIQILSNVTYTDLSIVIAQADVLTLSKIKGIGKKTAERLVTELKDKVNVLGDTHVVSQVKSAPEIDDAVEVLISLGLSKQEALSRAREVYSPDDSAEDVIRKALVNT